MGIVRQIKNVTGGYSASQKKVRDATANDDSRPPRHLLQEIADLSYDSHEVMLILDMIDKRLNDKGKYWRHVFKALILLDYLVHVGGDKVVMWCHENLYIVKTLREFNYRDDSGTDIGKSIRERAKTLTSLLMDAELLESERSRYIKGGRQPRRYRNRRALDDEDSSRSRSRGRAAETDGDDDLQKALELSKQTAAQEEERRRMAGRTDDGTEFQNAMDLSQQNQANMMTGFQYTYDPYLQQQQDLLMLQQQVQQQQAQADFLAAQQMQQVQAQQEAQALYNMQLMQAEAQAQQNAANEAYQQQLAQQNASLQPLQTGSNNPFAAFNQAHAQSQAQPQAKQFQPATPATPLKPSSTGTRSLHRQSTFDRGHMDRLDQILSLDAPMDTFGNTGSAMIPAQHAENTGFVDSSGRGLTATLTARQKTGEANRNPFAHGQYTGIASTQMQPAHTGFGFGNANRSSTNLIDL